jgi:two-component system, OmpR family, sensor histidine kinase CpxA
MRLPLAFKVSAWLLLNLLLLGGLGGAWLLGSGEGFSWNALVAGPLGRNAQGFAEVAFGDLRGLPRRAWSENLARVGAEQGVQIAVFSEDLRLLAGDVGKMPDEFRERMLSLRRPPPAPRDEFEGPDEAPRPPPQRPSRQLVRGGDPAAFWFGVHLGAPGRPREVFVVRFPGFWHLVDFLDLDIGLGLAGAGIAGSILLWLPFVLAHSRALRRLDHATEAIAGGRFDTRVSERGRDELAALGASINRMTGRLERLVDGQKRFLGDIAHELGSPLGRMQMGVGILEERAPAELQASVADVREEVVHMSDLVAELLAFTRAGLLPRDASRVRVELVPLVARVLAREAAGDAVTVDVPDGLVALADSDLLARAVGNLVRNAIRHAGRDGGIAVRARREGESVEIVVEDAGPGVPAEALARLGEPFFRPESARARETGGVGLGLSIVRAGVEACAGTVTFANRDPHGLRVTLRLAAAA